MESNRPASALRPHERRLVVAALPVVILVRLGLWALPLRPLQLLLDRLADATPAPQAHPDYGARAARAVARASRLVPGANGLIQALATLTLLRRRGLIGQLRVSARQDHGGAPQLQAAVELNGRLIVCGPAPFAQLPEQVRHLRTAP